MHKKKFHATDVFKHYEVADITIRLEVKFSSLEYFLNLFSVLEKQKDEIEHKFASYRTDVLNKDILISEHCDLAWILLTELININGTKYYKMLSSILCKSFFCCHIAMLHLSTYFLL